MKDKFNKWITAIKKLPIAFIGCLILIVACLGSLFSTSENPAMPIPALSFTTSFDGVYKIGDGDWKALPADGHISSTEDDVTLRGKFIVSFEDGQFLTDNPEGFYFNFYCNHIFLTISLGGETIVSDTEYPQNGEWACGAMWLSYLFPNDTDGVVEIVISNPHKHGNELAIDEFLGMIQLDDPTVIADSLAKQYDTSRYMGFSFVALALVVFVLTVVAFIAKLKIAKVLWIIAFWVLFTGGIYILDVADVFFWNENLPFNTAALCLCQMLSSFFLSLFATNCLTGKNKKIGGFLQAILGGITLCAVLLAAFGVVRIFDIKFYWYLIYAIQFIVLSVLCIREIPNAVKGIRFVLISSMISMLCVLVDFFAGVFALWGALYLSKTVFGAMLVIVIAFGIHSIITNYKISMRAREMETELKDKSIAVMISQIQPHFLYNSLNSIAELCVVDPKRAEKATINFSRYLRGNMGALNEKKPIEFEDELSHLNHYIELEKIRYGDDLKFEYDIRETAFTLPALTVQPLVENAVNHGIRYHKMKGKVKISTYADENNYYVAIEDDGVGFDPNQSLNDGREHVGLANVKYRLEILCGGSVDIKSEKDKGTLVTIRIPREK